MSCINSCKRLYDTEAINNEKGGVALVLVVWVIVVLTAMVGEFAYSMRTEINIARNFKEEEEAYQLALAGVEQAKMELLEAKKTEVMYLDEDGNLQFGEGEEKPERRGEFPRGSFEYTINDEDGKLNINLATEAQLKELFNDSGVDVTDVDTIVDSIFDWKDDNDLHRISGAEEDYYRSLDVPYSCKDGLFNTVKELLLVKGMNKEILYGSKDKQDEDEKYYTGVIKYLTVYGSNIINVNTAPENVIRLVLDQPNAQNILNLREAGPIYTLKVARSKISSEFFTILSTGKNMDGSIKRTVKAVVRMTGNNVETLYWNDNFIG